MFITLGMTMFVSLGTTMFMSLTFSTLLLFGLDVLSHGMHAVAALAELASGWSPALHRREESLIRVGQVHLGPFQLRLLPSAVQCTCTTTGKWPWAVRWCVCQWFELEEIPQVMETRSSVLLGHNQLCRHMSRLPVGRLQISAPEFDTLVAPDGLHPLLQLHEVVRDLQIVFRGAVELHKFL